MSELRHWSAEGATEAERALLEASRNERPGASARARTLAAIGAGVGLATATSSATATATVTATATGSLLFKVIGVAVVTCGVGTGAAVWQSSRSGSVAPSAPIATAIAAAKPVDAPKPPVAPEASASAASEAEDATAAPSADTAARARPPAPHPSSSASLAGEVAALERAHRALASNDSAAAARELDRYHAKYPQGSMSSEETVLRVQSLLARKEDAKAVALAESFCAAHPDSPYARRIRELVRGKEKK